MAGQPLASRRSAGQLEATARHTQSPAEPGPAALALGAGQVSQGKSVCPRTNGVGRSWGRGWAHTQPHLTPRTVILAAPICPQSRRPCPPAPWAPVGQSVGLQWCRRSDVPAAAPEKRPGRSGLSRVPDPWALRGSGLFSANRDAADSFQPRAADPPSWSSRGSRSPRASPSGPGSQECAQGRRQPPDSDSLTCSRAPSSGADHL